MRVNETISTDIKHRDTQFDYRVTIRTLMIASVHVKYFLKS